MIYIAWCLGIGAICPSVSSINILNFSCLSLSKHAMFHTTVFVCVYIKYVLNFEAIVTNVVHLENICLVVLLSSHSHDVMDFSELKSLKFNPEEYVDE